MAELVTILVGSAVLLALGLVYFRRLRLLPAWHPSASALLEVGLLFLPAVPAYLWVWPRLSEPGTSLFQILTYLYVLSGTSLIGLRRWSWDALGVNRRGLGLSLACGLAILAGRLLIILSIEWKSQPAPLAWTRLAGDLLFYFGLVGLVEELLFRGLVYRLLEDWRGAGWAIWGSSLGFGLWHVFGQGPLAGLATLAIGVLFALIRWRAGGIAGLIVLHGLWDLESKLLVASSNAEILAPGAFRFESLAGIWVGVVLLFLVPAAILLGPWLIERRRMKHGS
jgi:membrane protease YdiL (CAAX protease family)